MIYRIIRIHSREGGHMSVTPILNLCNQLETHFYSQTVAVIQSVTQITNTAHSSRTRWILSALLSALYSRTGGT